MKTLSAASWLASTLITLLTCASANADCTNRNAAIALDKPDSIYVDHFDGTVTDTQTGLMWQKCLAGWPVGQTWLEGVVNDASDDQCSGSASALAWQGALNAAQTANGNTRFGYNDWRLPNIKELKSLVEQACSSPSINELSFPATPYSTPYWSSSAYANVYNGGYSRVWHVDFNYGDVLYGINSTKSYNYHVRLVRDSQ